MVIGWGKQMKVAFGASFLWLVSLIYFTQGFRSFVWTAVSYQIKDVLKLSPSASQLVVSIAYFPWSIKPLYGILSDCIPIRGRKRVPYLVIATALSLIPWVVLGSASSMQSSLILLTLLLTIQSIGSAMADVVVDAMIAEAVRSDRTGLAADLQLLSWSVMALGGIAGNLLGGQTVSKLRTEIIFLLFSILPAIQLLSCALVNEIPSGLPKTPGKSSNLNDHGSISTISGSFHETPKVGSSRRRRNGSENGKPRVATVKSEAVDKKHSSSYLMSLRSAVYNLAHAFRQPNILRPMVWFFLSLVTVPNLSTAMFYYQTEGLHLEATFLGNARVIGWFGLMIGSYIYNRHMKRMRLRRILMWSHIGLAAMNLLDIALVSRTNIQFGIPDKYMVLYGSALGDAVNQFKMMPFLILSAQLCPPGIEGTLFALFMSINNLGSTLGSFVGAGLASALNISSDSFDNLPWGLTVQLLSNFLPIFFLFLIPKDATGLTS